MRSDKGARVGLGLFCAAAVIVITAAALFQWSRSDESALRSGDSAGLTEKQEKQLQRIRDSETELELRKRQKKIDVELQKERRRADVGDIFERMKNLRGEMARSSDPAEILFEYADIIRNASPESRELLIGMLVSNVLDLETADASFEWLVGNHEAVAAALDSVKSAQGQTVGDEFFEAIYAKFSLENNVDELYSKILDIKSSDSRIRFENALLPFIISSGKDYAFLDSITDPARRATIAKSVIVNLNSLSFNRAEAINCYLSPHFSSIDDPGGELLKTLVTPAWYESNSADLDALMAKSRPCLNHDRFMAQLARNSIRVGDGRAGEFVGKIKNKDIRKEFSDHGDP